MILAAVQHFLDLLPWLASSVFFAYSFGMGCGCGCGGVSDCGGCSSGDYSAFQVTMTGVTNAACPLGDCANYNSTFITDEHFKTIDAGCVDGVNIGIQGCDFLFFHCGLRVAWTHPTEWRVNLYSAYSGGLVDDGYWTTTAGAQDCTDFVSLSWTGTDGNCDLSAATCSVVSL